MNDYIIDDAFLEIKNAIFKEVKENKPVFEKIYDKKIVDFLESNIKLINFEYVQTLSLFFSILRSFERHYLGKKEFHTFLDNNPNLKKKIISLENVWNRDGEEKSSFQSSKSPPISTIIARLIESNEVRQTNLEISYSSIHKSKILRRYIDNINQMLEDYRNEEIEPIDIITGLEQIFIAIKHKPRWILIILNELVEKYLISENDFNDYLRNIGIWEYIRESLLLELKNDKVSEVLSFIKWTALYYNTIFQEVFRNKINKLIESDEYNLNIKLKILFILRDHQAFLRLLTEFIISDITEESDDIDSYSIVIRWMGEAFYQQLTTTKGFSFNKFLNRCFQYCLTYQGLQDLNIIKFLSFIIEKGEETNHISFYLFYFFYQQQISEDFYQNIEVNLMKVISNIFDSEELFTQLLCFQFLLELDLFSKGLITEFKKRKLKNLILDFVFELDETYVNREENKNKIIILNDFYFTFDIDFQKRFFIFIKAYNLEKEIIPLESNPYGVECINLINSYRTAVQEYSIIVKTIIESLKNLEELEEYFRIYGNIARKRLFLLANYENFKYLYNKINQINLEYFLTDFNKIFNKNMNLSDFFSEIESVNVNNKNYNLSSDFSNIGNIQHIDFMFKHNSSDLKSQIKSLQKNPVDLSDLKISILKKYSKFMTYLFEFYKIPIILGLTIELYFKSMEELMKNFIEKFSKLEILNKFFMKHKEIYDSELSAFTQYLTELHLKKIIAMPNIIEFKYGNLSILFCTQYNELLDTLMEFKNNEQVKLREFGEYNDFIDFLKTYSLYNDLIIDSKKNLNLIRKTPISLFYFPKVYRCS